MKIKYNHLLNKNFTRRITKSKYPNIFLYFIEFSDPGDIKYEIASETNIPVHTIRSLLRPAKNNETISDGLVDLGVRELDIPGWFAISKNLRRMIKEVKKRPQKVRARMMPRIQEESLSVYPIIEYLNLPNPVRTPEEIEDARIRDNMQAQVAVYNRAREEAIKIISWKIYQAREEERRENQKEKDKRELMARINAKIIFNTMMRNYQFNQMMYAKIMSQPLHPTNLKKEFFDMIQNLCDIIINFAKDLNKRREIPNINHELQSLEPRDWSDLNDQIKEILENEPSLAENIQAILELGNYWQERDRSLKIAKYGNLIKPVEINWPTGFKPPEIFFGPRGRWIKKRINLDRLR